MKADIRGTLVPKVRVAKSGETRQQREDLFSSRSATLTDFPGPETGLIIAMRGSIRFAAI